jgi:hypothetical protein
MEKNKKSKKALRGLINDSMREAISSLELPEPTKKVKKLLQRNSKKLASIFADVLKREEKKKRKAEKFIEDAVNIKGKKRKKINEMKLQETGV